MSKLTSLSSVQTKGLKRQFAEDNWINKMNEAGTEIEQIVVNKTEGTFIFKSGVVLLDNEPTKGIQLQDLIRLSIRNISETFLVLELVEK